MRILQILADTADTSVNLNALRFHQNLAAHGDEVRTLAMAPGAGAVVSSLVPAMAPSPRSLAAFTQLRREMRWPDVLVLDDCLPLAATTGRHPPVVLRLSAQAPDRLVQRLGTARARHVSAVVIADDWIGERITAAGFRDVPVYLIRPPFDHRVVSMKRVESARRSARRELGIGNGELAVVLCDQQRGIINVAGLYGPDGDPLVDIHPLVSRANALITGAAGARSGDADATMVRLVVPQSADQEMLFFAADIAVAAGTDRSGSPGPVPAVLVDLMAIGVVPVCLASPDRELLVDGRTAVLMDRDSDEPGTGAARTLVGLAGDQRRRSRLSEQAREAARLLCDPDEVYRRWSGCLDQALPSLP